MFFEINNYKSDKYLIFFLSFLFFGIITYLIQNLFYSSSYIYGDNSIYFISPDAVKFWYKSDLILRKSDNIFVVIHNFDFFDNNFYVKVFTLIRFIFEHKLNIIQFNSPFILTIPVFLFNSFNSVLIFYISILLQKKMSFNNKFIPYIISFIYILSPFCSIWYSSIIDESFIIFSILILTYYYLLFIDQKRITYSAYFLILISLLIIFFSRIELYYVITFFFIIHIFLKYIDNKIILRSLFFLICTALFTSSFFSNLNITNFIYFFKPSPFDWFLTNDIKNFILSTEAILNYFFFPGILIFFFSKFPLKMKVFSLIILLMINYFISNYEYGTALRYIYIFKIYLYFISVISYIYILNKYINIKFQKSIEVIFFSLFSFMNIFLFIIRDLIIYNNILDIDKINFISQTLYLLNILTTLFLLPMFERQLSTTYRISKVFLINYIFISISIFIIIFVLASYLYPIIFPNYFQCKLISTNPFIEDCSWKLPIFYTYFSSIVFLIIPSSLIFFFNSYLIKNNMQIIGSLSHLIVPITVISFLIFLNNSYLDLINSLLFGTTIGVFLNLAIITIFSLKTFPYNPLQSILPIKLHFKYIIMIYKKYFYPSIYITILVFCNIFLVQYFNYNVLFLWILAIKFPITISLIIYSVYNNYLVNQGDVKFIKLFTLIFLLISMIFFILFFSNYISDLLLYSDDLDYEYKKKFAFFLRIFVFLPLIMLVTLYIIRKLKSAHTVYLLIFSFIFSLIFVLYFSNIYAEIVNYFVFINLLLLSTSSFFLFIYTKYPKIIWTNKLFKNG